MVSLGHLWNHFLAIDTVPFSVADKLRSLSASQQCRPGERIFNQGEVAHSVYFISMGMVRVFRTQGRGYRQMVRFSSDGDIIGLPHNGLHANSAESVYDTLTYRLPWQPLRQLMLASPDFQTFVFDKVASRLRQVEAHLLMLRQSVFCRVAMFLIEMTESRFFDPERSQLTLPMTRLDIADYLGTSLATVTRGIAKMEDWGIVRCTSARQIHIMDLDRLRSLRDGPRRLRSDHD